MGSSVDTVIAALIGFWGVVFQKTGKLFWWRKPNPSPSKPSLGNPDSPSSSIACLTERGLSSYNQGLYQEALNYCQQALIITREVGDRSGEGTALSNIGAVHHTLGQYDQALENYQQALVIAREVKHRALEEINLPTSRVRLIECDLINDRFWYRPSI